MNSNHRLTTAGQSPRSPQETSPISDLYWTFSAALGRATHGARIVANRLPFLACSSSPAAQGGVIEFLRLMEPKQVVGFRKHRVGSPGDGGYVQIEDLSDVSCALSFGISDDDSWDLAMAEAELPVEQFDHTIERAPSSHPRLRFHRKRIGVDAADGCATLPDLVKLHSRRATPDVILKIDIEGCEWDVFDHADEATLSKLAQIICELHGLSRLNNARFRARAMRVFEKMNRHFAVVHVHGNNYRRICNVANVCLPEVLEITLANRGRYDFVESPETFPTPLDAPCCPHFADVALGSFRF
jgi:hypothetical protein